MNRTDAHIPPKCAHGFSDFIQLARKIGSDMLGKSRSGYKTLKIAFLSSFTTKGIDDVLLVKCHEAGVWPTFYVGGYNQYAQEILNPESGVYKFDPDLIVLFIDTDSILGELRLDPYSLSDDDRKKWADDKLSEIEGLIDKIKAHCRANILLHNFEVPAHSPLGILEDRQPFGFLESIRYLNRRLNETSRDDGRLFIFDYDRFCSKIGKDKIRDAKMYYMGDVKLKWDYMPQLCDAYLGYIKPLLSLSKKCIVVDLDNTLWGGVVGEDGYEGVRLGPTPEGRPFVEFQRHLLAFFKKGVLLAINSRNNYDEAIKVIREHPHMVLREANFASIKINWDDKVSNMKAIAREINIGLESMAFIDDDKVNRDMVKSALPQVLVTDLPEDPALYVEHFLALNEFNALQFTEEDKRRGALYASNRLREDFKSTTTDLDGYLKKLETIVTIESSGAFNIPRIAQLTQRTNQFNMTTRRYLEGDIKRFAEDKAFLVWSISAKDKFGDNGIVSAVIIKTDVSRWYIGTFLLSCRVIGRRIEEAILGCILNEAARNGAVSVTGEFIPTVKNMIAKDFYRNNGFELVDKTGDKELWEYKTSRKYLAPGFVKIVRSYKR